MASVSQYGSWSCQMSPHGIQNQNKLIRTSEWEDCRRPVYDLYEAARPFLLSTCYYQSVGAVMPTIVVNQDLIPCQFKEAVPLRPPSRNVHSSRPPVIPIHLLIQPFLKAVKHMLLNTCTISMPDYCCVPLCNGYGGYLLPRDEHIGRICGWSV